jgi:pre-60S factor REI1
MSCISCKLLFPTTEEQKIHFKSDFHRYNLKRKVLGLGFVSLAEFEAKQPKQAIQVEQKTNKKHEKRLELKKEKEQLYDDLLQGKVQENELKNCPICKIEICDISHLSAHGLYLPPKTDTLLSFINTKVMTINCCLFCDKQFYTTEQVVSHMKVKSHFKLNDNDFDQFEVESEVESGDDGDWEDESVEENEQIAYVENEELTLPNGKVLGSRQMMRYYKQNLTSSAAHGSLNAAMNPKGALISTRGGAGQLIKSHAELVKEKQVKKASLNELKRGNDFRSRVGQKQNMLQHHYREQNPF